MRGGIFAARQQMGRKVEPHYQESMPELFGRNSFSKQKTFNLRFLPCFAEALAQVGFKGA